MFLVVCRLWPLPAPNLCLWCVCSPMTPSESDEQRHLLTNDSSTDSHIMEQNCSPSRQRRQASLAFWLLGLCNNYAYVIMLSAAHDLLKHRHKNTEPPSSEIVSTTAQNANGRDCNDTSTGAILLADVLPGLIIKLVIPLISLPTGLKVALTVVLSAMSFVLAADWTISLIYIGVVCASLGSGLGEVTFLAHCSHYSVASVMAWSSGTGFSGVLGSGSYAVLTACGLSARSTLLLMLVCPVIMVLTYWCVLPSPSTSPATARAPESGDAPLTWREKLLLLPMLPTYMLPLGTVYFLQYFINQGLLELAWVPSKSDVSPALDHASQYRWLQVVYQVGVFVSRSSAHLLPLRRIWPLALLQALNAAFFLLQACLMPVRAFWPLVFVVLWEGLLGGSAYVNTFVMIHNRMTSRAMRHFVLGTVSLADSSGIALAGAVALPVHSAICRSPLPR